MFTLKYTQIKNHIKFNINTTNIVKEIEEKRNVKEIPEKIDTELKKYCYKF